jgi:hypothetical protein
VADAMIKAPMLEAVIVSCPVWTLDHMSSYRKKSARCSWEA